MNFSIFFSCMTSTFTVHRFLCMPVILIQTTNLCKVHRQHPGQQAIYFVFKKLIILTAAHNSSGSYFIPFSSHIRTETIYCPLLPPSSSSVLPSTPHLIDPSHIPECTYSFCILVIFPIFSCSCSITLAHLLIHSSFPFVKTVFFIFIHNHIGQIDSGLKVLKKNQIEL